ncbi:MAG: hypothetical protein GXP47_04840 [Acidobacteria bacterium]|nr:hypothetical protein [Acidobacteriota bacterium]
MTRRSDRGRRLITLLILWGGLLVFGSGLVFAENRSRTPAPTPTPVPTRNPNSLAAVASKIHLRKPGTTSRSSGVVITNENIKSYAEKGNLTTASGQPARTSATGSMPFGRTTTGQRKMSDDAKKSYWRNAYIRQKQLVDSIKKRIDELNREIPGLWRDFYAWDDPAYRDGVIKPKIDKKLKEVEELKKRLPAEEKKLPKILEDARRDGALPGWFRDLT